MTRPLAITMGDAAGIGPEIIARHFVEKNPQKTFVIGDPTQIRRALTLINATMPVHKIDAPEDLQKTGISVLPVGQLPPNLPYGRVDARAGRIAYDAIVKAIRLAQSGSIASLVTAPIHKEALHAAGIGFPGHTEILAHETGTRDFGMMLMEGKLRVILVSIHLSLRDALDKITIENEIRTIRLALKACQALGLQTPRIAVAGLNPHAGEGGLFGREEIDTIIPAIAAMRAEGVDISGPYPPDTVFMQAKRGLFDLVVAQYHDQGLIPIKLNGIEKGVNITVGLPIIRTSVDHGTAFDIAGKGIADPSSLAEAIDIARLIENARN